MAKNPTLKETAKKEIESLTAELNGQKDHTKELKSKIRTRMQIIKRLEAEEGEDGKEAKSESYLYKVPSGYEKEGSNQRERKKV